MALRIVKASEPITVEKVIICLYSSPGVGKTSLGFTADSPLLLDFDGGAYRSGNRGDSVPVKQWEDAATIAVEDLAGYRTVVVDTVGRALDVLSADIIQRDPKLGRGGALTLQGFGKLKAEFTAWLKHLRSFGVDVVLLAHMDEQKSGDDLIERIDAQGASKNEIYKCSDAMGRLTIRGQKRVLMFSPTDTSFGKNPASLDAIQVPPLDRTSVFLGDIIRTIKSRLNQMTEEQRQVAGLLAEWHGRIAEATTAAGFNALIKAAEELDTRVRDNGKRLLWNVAKEHNLVFDKANRVFTEKPAEAVSA